MWEPGNSSSFRSAFPEVGICKPRQEGLERKVSQADTRRWGQSALFGGEHAVQSCWNSECDLGWGGGQGLQCRVQAQCSVPGVLGSHGRTLSRSARGGTGDGQEGKDETRRPGRRMGPRAVGKERRGQVSSVTGQEGQGSGLDGLWGGGGGRNQGGSDPHPSAPLFDLCCPLLGPVFPAHTSSS